MPTETSHSRRRSRLPGILGRRWKDYLEHDTRRFERFHVLTIWLPSPNPPQLLPFFGHQDCCRQVGKVHLVPTDWVPRAATGHYPVVHLLPRSISSAKVVPRG